MLLPLWLLIQIIKTTPICNIQFKTHEQLTNLKFYYSSMSKFSKYQPFLKNIIPKLVPLLSLSSLLNPSFETVPISSFNNIG